MMKKLAFIVMAVIFAASILAGTGLAADTIKIGFNAPLTGFAASDGKSASEGSKLAVEQITYSDRISRVPPYSISLNMRRQLRGYHPVSPSFPACSPNAYKA